MFNEDEKIRGRGHCCSLVPELCACGSDTASKDENVIHIMSSGDSSANMERALVDEYNKTADVKAVLDLVTSADYQNKLQTVMSNPKSDSAPDIFFNWADALMIQYARADVSAPLDEYMEKDPELKDNFLPSILDAAKVDGKYYGIPVRGVQPIVLFYNKKVLSDNGIEAPTTFDEFCDACEKLKSAGLTPIALGGGDQWPTLNWYSVIYQQVMGNDDVQKMMDGGVDEWSSPKSKKALEIIRDMVEKGYFGTTYDSVKHTDGAAPALLEQGKAGFELMGSFGYSGHKAAAPEFTNDDLGYMVFPPIDGVKGDAKDLVGNPCNYFSMNKYTKHPEACVEFLKMLYSDKCVEDQLKAGNLPATTNASEMVEKVVDNASDGAFLEWESQALTDAPHFMITWTPNHVSSSSQPMLDGMQQYFNGSIDMGTFIDEMKALPTE